MKFRVALGSRLRGNERIEFRSVDDVVGAKNKRQRC